MAENLKVFISYSHDKEHMRWISDLVTKLHLNGVNIILDPREVIQDQEMTQFMEAGVRDADRILVICTDSYVRKANEGEGGVGYEPTIITRRIVEDMGTHKFIPIIRQTLTEEKTPAVLKDRAYIDFTNDEQFDVKFEELLH